MKNRGFPKLAILAATLAFVALAAGSCALDYKLWFELGDIGIAGNVVEVDYTITNQGSRSLENATISIRVTCDAGNFGPQEQIQDTPPEDLFLGESSSGTLTFTFPDLVSDVFCEVVAAGWDEPSSED